MQDRLVFLIGSPRSGSTLLSRILGAHTAIFAPEEPHLITPLAHLGFYDSVDSAPYDPIIARAAARALVPALPRGEADYLDALRAYSDAIYNGLAAQESNATLVLDKTPAYSLSLDFLSRLYPEARYLVLTRHPLAIWSSFVDSFFDGDDAAAHAHNPLLERYVPAIARFLRTTRARVHRVDYEDLVQDPDASARQITDFLDIPFEPQMINYGAAPDARGSSTRGLGDPTSVAQHSRPTTQSLAKWISAAAGQPDRVRLYREIVARLGDDDLEVWGYPRKQITADLAQIDLEGQPAARARTSRYALERRILVGLRRRIQPDNGAGRAIKKLRELCDVLLR